ncbi:MAG: hypothetical protein ACSHWS_07960 [Sulfitobacter sp.]
MTMEEAIALQPAWVGIWLNWLFFGAFILPVALLIWRQSRLAAVLTVGVGVLAGAAVYFLYEQLGYVKLLGLPHVILWTPLAYYLFQQIKRPDMPDWPRRIIWVVLITLLISLAFDYVDVIRYLLGNRTPLAMPA